MIRVNKNESFPITVSLIDESIGEVATGKTVYYDVRQQPNDVELSPPLNGVLVESSIASGIYTTVTYIDTAGSYVVYATCSGFTTNTEEVIVDEDNLANLVKQNRHFNTSVEDVIRTNSVATASQTARKVGVGKTDYVLTRVKPNYAADWDDSATVSGVVYAHYRELDDQVPYLMGGPF